MNNLAGLYVDQGIYYKAEPLYLKALSIREKKSGPEHPDTAIVMNNLALLYQDKGLYEKAEKMLLKVLDIDEKTYGKNNIKTSITLNNLAFLYRDQGIYKKAENLFLRAISIEEKILGSEHLSLANKLNNLAILYHDQGLYNKAESLYLKTLSIREKALGPEHPDMASIFNNLALLYNDLNLNTKAESLYLKALSIREKVLGPEHPDTAITLGSLGLLYTYLGSYSKAEPLYIRALNITEKIFGPEHPDTANYLDLLSGLYSRKGLYSKAIPMQIRALDIRKKSLGLNHPETGVSFFNLGSLYSKQGFYDKAENLLLKSLSTFEKGIDIQNTYVASTLYELASIYLDQDKYDKSREILKRAQNIDISIIQREIPFLPLQDRHNFFNSFENSYQSIFRNISKDDSFKNLALFSRLNRQGLLEEIEKRQTRLSSLRGEQKQLVMELKKITQKLSSQTIDIQVRKKLTQKKNSLERKIYSQIPELEPNIISIKEVQKLIPKDGYLIEFQRFQDLNNSEKDINTNNYYLALITNNKGVISAINLGLADPIENKIKKALISSEQGFKDAQELWNEISSMVIEPLTNFIPDAKILFISPDAELNRIPFSALNSHKDNKLLSEVLRIRLLTTGRELLDLKKSRLKNNKKSIIVANPNFNLINNIQSDEKEKTGALKQAHLRSRELNLSNWSPLPGTAKEGKAISKIISADLFTNNNATTLLIQKQKSPKLLHIASHSYFLSDQDSSKIPLLRSGIVLAGANNPNSNKNDDGYLTSLEFTKLELDGTDLVVISGCESGIGEIKSGEGVYGLKRSISVAGAKSSLLSLWKVADNSTAAFMEKFYRKLKLGKSKDESLFETQQEFRNHPIEAWRHPNVWAAFQLSGDWRPIDF